MKKAFKFLVVVIAAFLLISPLTASAITSPAASSVWVEGKYQDGNGNWLPVVEKNGKKGYNLTNTKKDWILNLTMNSDYKKLSLIFDMADPNYTVSVTSADGKAYTATSGQEVRLDLEFGENNFNVVFTDPTDNSVENHTLKINLSDSAVPNTGAFANIALIGSAGIVAVGAIILANKKAKFHRI